jgi:protein-S-isoprenylcysteine O-methyltransferase Ste14
MCLVGLCIRNGYELLKKAGKTNTENPLVFAIVFVSMCLMLASWPIMCFSDPAHVVLPRAVHLAGLGVWIIGLSLALGALIQLRGVENIDHLVTAGLFSIFRHPMYLGFILWIMGWVIYFGAAVSFLVGLAGVGSILFWQRLEEEKLVACYSEVYQKYRKGTWF